MKKRFSFSLFTSALLLAASASLAEVKVAAERNAGDAATGDFKFKNVPAPSPTDRAVRARFEIVSGRPDPNGGAIDRLTDGRLPADDDQPRSNFFFSAGTEGGRLLLDLGEATDVLQVNTYSWHRDTRAPQVYKLYAAGASAPDFNARPEKDTDPEKAGWKLIASVDTRGQEGGPGGQYGVSLSDAAGGPLGKFRYLLFDVSRTEADDSFGNTFFSEIDVSDGKEHAPAVASTTRPTTAPAEEDVLAVAGKYEIVFDTSQMPEIKEWVDKKLKPVCAEWYPKIVEMLPSDGYTAPRRFTIIFHKDMPGVANAGGARINCAGPWFMKNLEGEAVGAVVHEMVHIVQQYRRLPGRANNANRNPGWLVEGLADYIRWMLYEPEGKRRRINPERAKYTDSYHVTGAFLDYVVRTHDKEFVKKLNAAMRHGKYTPELWKELTGKTVEELWEEYVKTLEKR
jgi:hypothetical protein